MRKISCFVSYSFVVLVALSRNFMAVAQAQEDLRSLSDFVYTASEKAHFDVGDRRFRIWESTRNVPEQPTLWQFRYDPLFLPEIGSDGQVALETRPFVDRWRTSLRIALDNIRARRLAYESVVRSYPDVGASVLPENIYVLPVQSVRVSIPELSAILPEAEIVTSLYNFASPPSELLITIETRSLEQKNTLEEVLPEMKIDYNFSLSAREASVSWIEFSLSTLKESSLFTQLNGLGSNIVYVHRDDLRRLTENISNQVRFNAIIENPEHFEQQIFDKLSAIFSALSSSERFDAAKWESTYNEEDLRPTVIGRWLNKRFSKDESESTWKFAFASEDEASGSFFDIVSASAKSKTSYTDEELKRLLRERNVEVEIEGAVIVPKTIYLNEINLSTFSSDNRVHHVKTYVRPAEVRTSAGSIEMFTLSSSRGISSLPVRLATLELGQVPVGSILPFYGDPELLTGTGWVVCSRENSESEEFRGKVPNLESRFIVGAGNDYALGQMGGASDIPKDGAHDHDGTTGNVPGNAHTSIDDAAGNKKFGAHHVGHVHGINMGGGHDHGSENRPPYYALYYIIRVR